jgi:hypothetical protein
LEVATIQNAIRAFQSSGIWPYNNNVYSDADVAPPPVTDRPYSDFTLAPAVVPDLEDPQPCEDRITFKKPNAFEQLFTRSV